MAGQEAVQKFCAYCGSDGPFSREHIWPRGIIKRVPDYDARYFGNPDKVLSAEHTIRDVCTACNNGVLSELDAYGCRLFDDYFHLTDIRGAPVNFRYDFDLILRWLLKISYNASRSVGIDTEYLQRCVPYILGAEDTIKDVWLLAVLVEPVTGIIRGVYDELPPYGVRAARVETAEDVPLPFIVRLVAVNAFYFLLVITKDGEAANFALAKRLLPGKQVPRTRRSVWLRPSGLDTRDVWLGHMVDKDHLYREHFARRRSKSGEGLVSADLAATRSSRPERHPFQPHTSRDTGNRSRER